MREVLLSGHGLAVAACGRLLGRAGWSVKREGGVRRQVPVVVLNGATQNLLQDIFGEVAAGYRIERRIVKWGGETVELPHVAVALPEEALLRGVEEEFAGGVGEYRIEGNAGALVAVGERWAEVVEVSLRGEIVERACWVEAVEEGWLFLVEVAPGRGVLIGVGSGLEELLGTSELVAGVVDGWSGEKQRFASQPRIARVMTGGKWLACGGAAMAFDPICGEGTGHALREAILASAVLKAHAGGGDWDTLAGLYEGRLRAGFRRHLEQCLTLYGTGGRGPWWRVQQAGLAEALRAMPQGVAGQQGYRLVDFELVRT